MKIEDIDIIALAKECPRMSLIITASDLIKAQEQLIHTIREETRKNKELYTTEEVLKTLNVVPSTLWRWRKKGYLIPIKVCGQHRYKSEDIEAIINGKK